MTAAALTGALLMQGAKSGNPEVHKIIQKDAIS